MLSWHLELVQNKKFLRWIIEIRNKKRLNYVAESMKIYGDKRK